MTESAASSATESPLKLVDSFGRLHNNLRISVTDRCNIRCFYCMPAEDVQFMPREELLTFEEIACVVRIGTTLGIDRVRVVGGAPGVASGRVPRGRVGPAPRRRVAARARS